MKVLLPIITAALAISVNAQGIIPLSNVDLAATQAQCNYEPYLAGLMILIIIFAIWIAYRKMK